MKNFLNKIKSLLSKDSKKIKEKVSPIRPHRDWVVIFILSLLGVVLVAVFGFYLLFIMQSGKFFVEVNPEGGKGGFEEEKLIKTIEAYKKKSDDFSELKEKKVTVPDPSV